MILQLSVFNSNIERKKKKNKKKRDFDFGDYYLSQPLSYINNKVDFLILPLLLNYINVLSVCIAAFMYVLTVGYTVLIFKNNFHPISSSLAIIFSKLKMQVLRVRLHNSLYIEETEKRAEPYKCDIRLVSRILWHERVTPSSEEWRLYHLIPAGNFPP